MPSPKPDQTWPLPGGGNESLEPLIPTGSPKSDEPSSSAATNSRAEQPVLLKPPRPSLPSHRLASLSPADSLGIPLNNSDSLPLLREGNGSKEGIPWSIAAKQDKNGKKEEEKESIKAEIKRIKKMEKSAKAGYRRVCSIHTHSFSFGLSNGEADNTPRFVSQAGGELLPPQVADDNYDGQEDLASEFGQLYYPHGFRKPGEKVIDAIRR
jgi:hypothetical protein